MRNIHTVRFHLFLTTFACNLGRYRYERLSLGAVSTGDMFQEKIDEIFKVMPNLFGIVDNIMTEHYEEYSRYAEKNV